MMLRRNLFWFIPFLTTTLMAVSADDGGGAINAPDGVAVHGYDAVSYFAEDGPQEGKASISTVWSGVEWRFASQENKDLFLADPEKYAPQYGGYCAWAVGRGYLADIDPQQYVIRDGRLFLNFNGVINLRFKSRLKANINTADQNWPEIKPE